MNNKIITLFGATGFIGAEIVRVLSAQGYTIRIATSNVKKADMLKFNGAVGQIVPYQCDYSEQSLKNTVDGSFAVINCMGILSEKGHRSFMSTHCYVPESIAQACKKMNVNHFVHISALGVDKSKSDYAKSKLAGEKQVLKAFKNVTILRPSIVFGAKDSFFNMFAGMAKILPFLPLIGGGKTLFQPVYVGDVALAVSNAIKKSAFGVYELGGPDVLSFKALLQKMKLYTGQSVCLLPVPFFVAKIQAVMLSVLPNPPITLDQIKSLKTDNIVADSAKNLSDLNVIPTSLDVILPGYLERFKN
jgi:NADH dehydrogenase